MVLVVETAVSGGGHGGGDDSLLEGGVFGIFGGGKQGKGVCMVCLVKLVVRGPLPVVVCHGCSRAKVV